MTNYKTLAIKALKNMKGDDTSSVRAVFSGMSDNQMSQQHGQSGKTRKQILTECEQRDAEIDAAISWVKYKRMPNAEISGYEKKIAIDAAIVLLANSGFKITKK